MRASIAVPLLLAPICVLAQQQPFDGKSWWQDVEILAADNMEGRGIGTAGLQRAEAYVVDRVQNAGLAPAGTHGYYQPLQFVTRHIDEKASNVELVRNGKSEPLVLGEDAAFTALVDVPTAHAPLVFVGHGLNVPELHYNDLSGIDVKGKIAVTLEGNPPGFGGELAMRYSENGQRWKMLHDAGAIGWIILVSQSGKWQGSTEAQQPTIHLAHDPETEGEQLCMWLNPAHADKVFAGSGHTVAELFELSRAGKPLPRFPLPVEIRATQHVVATPLESANVIAKFEGSDPALKNEYVVLSAHIDHLGIGKPLNGDPIYHGAIDNASGVAVLLDIADELKKEHVKLKRSLLFTFFTAEEQGQLGSVYFVTHPTVQKNAILADINLDGVHAIVPLRELRVIGMEESTLGDAAARVAAAQSLGADSEKVLSPNEFLFHGDQGSFAEAGIPAIEVKIGFPGELAEQLYKFRRERYHTPADNLQQPINLETAAKFETIVFQLVLEVANNPERPQWKPRSAYSQFASSSDAAPQP